ncbi:MAG: hypothetical protein PHT79_12325 [Syntrophomonadaceae bacterium]|nr:hypothetical protein [Syntrophomonadaceae bacterium]MDD4550530.1 hypothetical protein [Syntrophomonadaceae bacterium]
MFKKILTIIREYFRTQIDYMYRDWDGNQDLAFRQWLYCWGLDLPDYNPTLTKKDTPK